MADVSVQMGVSGVAQFKQGISDAQASVKTFDAALKANEKQLRATGDAENFMQAQTTLLNGKLREQQNIAKNAEQALKQMEQNGVKTTSKSYQDMQRRLIEAQSGMLDTQMELDNLGNKAADATGKTDQLATSLGGLNKKVSLDQVRAGIGSITNAMEQAARKAVELGKAIWDEVMDSARWADDTATMAQMYGIDIDTFQRMQKLVTGGLDTSVDAMLRSQDKLKKGIGKNTKEVMQTLQELGVSVKSWATVEGESGSALVTKDSLELFWEAGQAIMAMGDAYDKEAAAQALFGRGWKELVPLFQEYKTLDEYNAALGEQTVVSEKAVKDLAELNDAVAKLEGEFKTLERETIAALAPGLTKAADALSGLLDNVLKYLDTPKGQKALEDLGTAVEGLFKDLGSIDPAQVVEGFTGVLETVVGAVQWLVENKDTVIGAMEGILAGWAVLKVTGGALDVLKIITGIKELASGTVVASAASGLGNILTTAAGVALKAAPWLAGLVTLLNPSATDGSGVTENGMVTQAALDFWNNEPGQWQERLNAVGNRYGDLGTLMGNERAMNIILDPSISDEEVNQKLQEELGLVPIDVEPEVQEGAAGDIAEQIGVVPVPVKFVPVGEPTEGPAYLPRNVGQPWRHNANGIWSVPFDGYMSVLHKGERVVPAREVSSKNFSSNLYVENMNMGGGLGVEALAEALAARNRRLMSGFGL